MRYTLFQYFLAAAIGLTMAVGGGWADQLPVIDGVRQSDGNDEAGRSCSATAYWQFIACRNQIADDFFTARAFCTNVSDDNEREECLEEARTTVKEDSALCREQRQARRDLCKVFGEDRYDPDFDPVLFDNNFSNLSNPNPYFPLGIGNKWTFVGGDETSSDEVLNKTKLIEGVTCIVVRNIAQVDGKVIEMTDDWFGQRKDGDVAYCGEQVQNLVTFEGDDPAEPELLNLDGSFKVGRSAMPGTLFLRWPTVGQIYRQEWSPGEAEDVAEIVSTSYGFGSDAKLDANMPQDLAELLCANNCVVTRDFSPIEPGAYAYKYYARGIGLFFEVSVNQEGDTEVFQLIECNVDSKCTALPEP